jgi:hypothetical protein
LPAPAQRPAAPPATTGDENDDDEALLALAEDEALASEEPATEPILTAAQSQRLQGYSTAAQPLLTERLGATRDLLDHAGGERYSLELFVTDNTDPVRMERFLVRAREMVPLSDLYVIPMLAGAGRYRLRVVYGNYETPALAEAAKQRLPPKYLREFRVTAHSFEDLRRQL